MLLSPEMRINQIKHKSYKQLLRERDKLIHKIYTYERDKPEFSEMLMNPSPEVIYQIDLLYLAKLCELIVEKFREKEQ